MTKKNIALLITALALGLFFRLWHIEFGLPHSFYADEPELIEPAIKYTYEFKNIVGEKNYHKLIPVSYVYGTFPNYLNTVATMGFSKAMNILGISFDKLHIYVFLRVLNAVGSAVIIYTAGYLAWRLSQNDKVGILTSFLIALNWKLIVHAHYANADIIQTVLLNISFLTLYLYYKKLTDTKFTFITAILFGLAIGTKITTLIALPLYIYIFLVKKDFKELGAFIMISFGTYLVTNPFSFIFPDDFCFRVMEMFTKEAGMVFDSVDPSKLKYISALVITTTPLVFLTALYGKFVAWKQNKESGNKEFHIFLFLTILVYLLFFSLQSRRVDRWLLPILPIILMYSAWGLTKLGEIIKLSWVKVFIFVILFGLYLRFPILLLNQFQRYTPKAEAYLWLRDNKDEFDTVLGYTEEGLDPMGKLTYATINKVIVYTDESAQFFMPEDPTLYDYVSLASRPMEYHNKKKVAETYPIYAQRWAEFEKTILNEDKFELVAEFTLPKPNLIPLSDTFIYKRIE